MTYRGRFLRKYKLPDESYSLQEVSRITDIPQVALREVYKRGIGAWYTNIESVRVRGTFQKDARVPRSRKLPKEQWAMARVFSFVVRGKTFHTADKDIAERYNLE